MHSPSINILGKTTETALRYVPEYFITWLKLLYVSTNRFYLSRYINSKYIDFWF